MTPSQEEFVPQKIVVGRRGRRRGHVAPSTSSSDQSTKQDTITTTNNNITSVPLNDTQQKRNTRSTASSSAPQISSSVVFHEEDTEQLINELANDNNNNIEPSTTQLSSSQQQTTHHTNDTTNTDISSSVVFHEEQIELFDEIDELYPHEHEGGKIVADPHASTSSPPGISSSIFSNTTGKGGLNNSTLSGSLTTSRSLASSVIRSLHESNSLSGSKSYNGVLPTDYASLVASSNDGTLAEMVAEMTMARDNSDKQNANWDNDLQQEGLIRRNKSNPNLQQSLLSTLTEGSHEQSTKMSSISGGESNNNKNRRSSIVGGKPISQMSYEEQESPAFVLFYHMKSSVQYKGPTA